MAILHIGENNNSLYTFYNHRICKKLKSISPKYLKAFEFCQNNIRGIQSPNFESEKQMQRRLIYDKVKKETNELNNHTAYNDLSCYKIRKIIQALFNNEFKLVVNIFFKGGDFEREYFRDFVYGGIVNIIDLGNFNIVKYMDIIKKKNFNLCTKKRHSMLRKYDADWKRHCPQFEVLSFYEYAKLNL